MDIVQLAKFIQFLRSCEGSPLTISGTIRNPKRGQVKGSSITFKIDDEYISRYMEVFLNTLFDNYTLYDFIIYEDRKAFREAFGTLYFSGMYLPDALLEWWIKSEERNFLKGKADFGYQFSLLYKTLKDYASGFGEHKTKDYSFMYDIFVAYGKLNDIGEGFSGTIGKEKYQIVKNCIKAFQTQLEKREKVDLKEEFRTYVSRMQHELDAFDKEIT